MKRAEVIMKLVDNMSGGVHHDVFEQLHSYTKLTNGWCGLGSVAPDANCINRVRLFIMQIPKHLSGIPYPKVAVSFSGDMELYWDDGIVYIDVRFEPNHKMSVFSRNRKTVEEIYYDSADALVLQDEWYDEAFKMLIASRNEVKLSTIS